MNNQKGIINIILIIAIAATLLVAGTYLAINQKIIPSLNYPIVTPTSNNPVACTQEAKLCPDGSYVSRTGPNCKFTTCKGTSDFGSPINFTIGKQITFSDGLAVTLTQINDSRCKAEAVCIWAGELSAVFNITGGNAGSPQQEVTVGTIRNKKITRNGYIFELQSATETSATIMINLIQTMCEYPAPPKGCHYVQGPGYNQQTACGMVLSCSNEGQISLQEGERDSSLLVQKIYSNYITGLNFREYPVATNQGEPITLYIKESVSNGCNITLTLISIQNNTAVFTKKTDNTKPCPICLAENTLIDTPDGTIAVQNLKTGMPVWTVDKFGKRVAATIVKNSKTPVSFTHQMVHIILDDKREIFASPGHPIGDGRFFNDLSVGQILDGGKIIVAEKMSYSKGYTYDILPSGGTGFYFANGILIDSTLH